jgi:hypothetical protein
MTAAVAYLNPADVAPKFSLASPRLQRWLNQHHLEIVEQNLSKSHFGSFFVTVSDGQLLTRFVSDRDGFIVQIGTGQGWTRLKTVLAFARDVLADGFAFVEDWPEVDPYDHRDLLLAALSDERLTAYKRDADVAELRSIGFKV